MHRSTTLRSTTRSTRVDRTTDDAWAVVASGRTGPQWYVDAAPWIFRGGVDRLAGGAGRRWRPPGRDLLRAGDTAGFWRVVEADDTAHRLVLVADVRAPGTVTLHTTVHPSTRGGAVVRQTVTLEPRGLIGVAYLLADLGARQLVMELAHRRLLRDLGIP